VSFRTVDAQTGHPQRQLTHRQLTRGRIPRRQCVGAQRLQRAVVRVPRGRWRRAWKRTRSQLGGGGLCCSPACPARAHSAAARARLRVCAGLPHEPLMGVTGAGLCLPSYFGALHTRPQTARHSTCTCRLLMRGRPLAETARALTHGACTIQLIGCASVLRGCFLCFG